MGSLNGSAITASELKIVLNSLKNQRDIIYKTYNGEIKNVLDSSQGCLTVSGVDYNSMIESFSSTFRTLDKHFDSLITMLEKNVIQNYSELSLALKKLFNNDLAARLNELLGLQGIRLN